MSHENLNFAFFKLFISRQILEIVTFDYFLLEKKNRVRQAVHIGGKNFKPTDFLTHLLPIFSEMNMNIVTKKVNSFKDV